MTSAPIRSTSGAHLLFGPDGNRRWAARKGIPAEDAYRELPRHLEKLVKWALSDYQLGSITLWLLQEYNLSRDSSTANALVDLALDSVETFVSSKWLDDQNVEVTLVGELEALDSVRPGASALAISRAGKARGGGPQQVRLVIGYNPDKELARAIERCASDNVEPTFGNLSARWSIPPVDIMVRTGQPQQMTNLSSYFPGIERGRLLSTSVYPLEFGRAELAVLLDTYHSSADSIAGVDAQGS